ncbi:MAG: hypothetical protein KGY76_09625 [Candidatus Thermoplasmatota archaeon]|nr:hypothetical protein [Candidatus Thermoplasmatota archaeon]
MKNKELLENLSEIKNEYALEEISIFDSEGYVLHTTQEGDFQAHNQYYGLPAGAAKLISDSYNQECEGVIMELEYTEFFLRFLREDDEMRKDVILSLEYEPNSKEREKLKSIIEDINELILEWESG